MRHRTHVHHWQPVSAKCWGRQTSNPFCVHHAPLLLTVQICQPIKGCHATVMIKRGTEVRLKPDLTEEQMEQWRRKHASKRRQGSSR